MKAINWLRRVGLFATIGRALRLDAVIALCAGMAVAVLQVAGESSATTAESFTIALFVVFFPVAFIHEALEGGYLCDGCSGSQSRLRSE